MENSQVILLRDYYNTDNGSGKPLAFSCSAVFNNEISFCNTDNFIVYDDDNAIIHAVMLTKDGVARQAETPYRICSGFYGNIQYMEGCFDMSGLKDAVQKMFVDTGLIDETQQESIMAWAGSIRNSIPKKDNVPYFTDTPLTPASFPDPTKPVRNDGMLRSTAKITTYTDYINDAMSAALSQLDADVRIVNSTVTRIAIDDKTEFAATIGDVVTLLMADEEIFKVIASVDNSAYDYALYAADADLEEAEANLIKMTAACDNVFMRVYYETSSVVYCIKRIAEDSPMTSNEFKSYINSTIAEFVNDVSIDGASVTFNGKGTIEIKTEAPIAELVNSEGVTLVETIMALNQSMLLINYYSCTDGARSVVEFNKCISKIDYGHHGTVRLAILDKNSGTKYYYSIIVTVDAEVIPDTSAEDMDAAITAIEYYEYPAMANTTTADEALESVTATVNTILADCAEGIELVEVATVEYVAPTEGVGGSYTFTAELSNGESIITNPIAVVIEALEVVDTTIDTVDALADAVEAYTFGPMDSSMSKNEMKADFVTTITSMPEYDADVIASVSITNVEFVSSTDTTEGRFVFTATITSTSGYSVTTDSCTAVISMTVPVTTIDEDIEALVAAIEAYTFGPIDDTTDVFDYVYGIIMDDLSDYVTSDMTTFSIDSSIGYVAPTTTVEGSCDFTVSIVGSNGYTGVTDVCSMVVSVHIETDEEIITGFVNTFNAFEFTTLDATVDSVDAAQAAIELQVAGTLAEMNPDVVVSYNVSGITDPTSTALGSINFTMGFILNDANGVTNDLAIYIAMTEMTDQEKLEAAAALIMAYEFTSLPNTVTTSTEADAYLSNIISDNIMPNFATYLSCDTVISEFTASTADTAGSCTFYGALYYSGSTLNTDSITVSVDILDA